MSTKQLYIDFDQYIRQGEPDKQEKAYAWSTAIGLQAVDGLTTSRYLQETAKRNIEGEITTDEAQQLIKSYYVSRKAHDANDDDKEEADRASANISQILSSTAFDFSTNGIISLHRRIFNGVFKHAGKIRDYDITKKEWVLRGDTVQYLNNEDLRRALDYDIEQEREFDYTDVDMEGFVAHFTRFVSGIWEIHAFGEGNTRTTAVFAIQYLRTLGFKVSNNMFAEHSWYFRNALVRANYYAYYPVVRKRNYTYLERFFRNLLMGEQWVLKNRYLVIDSPEEFQEQPRLDVPEQLPDNYPTSTQETKKSTQETAKSTREAEQVKALSTQEQILAEIKVHPFTTREQLAQVIGITSDGIKKQLDKLRRAGIIKHEGATKKGRWVILNEKQ